MLNMNRQIIHNFNQVYRKHNSLYVIDIDETILYYKNLNKEWFDDKKNALSEYYQRKNIMNKVYDLWEKELYKVNPIPTDYHGINNLIHYCIHNNSKVILLTARNKRVEDITKDHVNDILKYDIPIFFAGGKSKGKMLKKIINKYYSYPYENIYFIDDLEENCESVKDEIHNIITYLYRY